MHVRSRVQKTTIGFGVCRSASTRGHINANSRHVFEAVRVRPSRLTGAPVLKASESHVDRLCGYRSTKAIAVKNAVAQLVHGKAYAATINA